MGLSKSCRAIGMNEQSLLTAEQDLQPLTFSGDLAEMLSALDRWRALGLTLRVVRGRKSRSLAELFDEFAAAFQFPLYFGRNRSAFDDCISDLDWLPQANGFIIVVTEPDEVLVDEDASELEWFSGSLVTAARTFSQPIELGEWWDRPPVPFHVVFMGATETVDRALERWPR
jgi:hypothetical protein